MLSTGVYPGAYYLPTCLGTVVWAAVWGYLLATDLGGLGSQIIALITRYVICCWRRNDYITFTVEDNFNGVEF